MGPVPPASPPLWTALRNIALPFLAPAPPPPPCRAVALKVPNAFVDATRRRWRNQASTLPQPNSKME